MRHHLAMVQKQVQQHGCGFCKHAILARNAQPKRAHTDRFHPQNNPQDLHNRRGRAGSNAADLTTVAKSQPTTHTLEGGQDVVALLLALVAVDGSRTELARDGVAQLVAHALGGAEDDDAGASGLGAQDTLQLGQLLVAAAHLWMTKL